MSKIVFAVGHGKSKKGGYDSGATHNGYHEFKIAKEIAKYAQQYYNAHYNERCDLMNYNGNLSLKDRINNLQDDTYDLVAEFHLNASGGLGTEVYYHHNSERGKKYAEQITENISNDLGVRNRGAKIRLNGADRDFFGIIRQTKPCAILIETVFIDSSDLEKVKDAAGQRKCGEAIAKAVAAVRGIAENEVENDVPEEEPSKPTETEKPDFISPVEYKNGSTKENIYADNDLEKRIGSVSAREKADSYGRYGGKTLVVYNIAGGWHKAGFAKYAGKNPKAVGEWGADWQNGSTKETVFAESSCKTKIGTLDAYEKCKCLNKYDGAYLVCYKVTGTNTYKTGFVKYAGGLE